MTRRTALQRARREFGPEIIAQGSEVGTGYANRCYLLRRTTRLQPIGIGRTWDEALTDAYSTRVEKGTDHDDSTNVG